MPDITSRHPRRAAVAVGSALLALGLAGCSGGSGSDTASSDSGQASGSRAAAPVAAPTPGAAVAAVAGGAERAPDLQPASVIKTGNVTLVSKDIAAARSRIDELLTSTGGTLDDERSISGRDGSPRRSTLVLRVPVARFEAVKAALEKLGTLRSSTESAEDVTTRVIDTRERVQTLQNSLDRLQRFQRAATDVRDLIRFEDDITSRQAELQSLKGQQSYLADQTSMSTITVTLTTPAATAAPRSALAGAGFLPGLRHGWDALVGVAVVALTAVGALLPWLVVLVALGWPALLLLRRRSRRTPPASA
jgi:hypothetical protein